MTKPRGVFKLVGSPTFPPMQGAGHTVLSQLRIRETLLLSGSVKKSVPVASIARPAGPLGTAADLTASGIALRALGKEESWSVPSSRDSMPLFLNPGQ